MEQTKTKNSIFRLAPGRHVLLLVSAAVIAAHLLTRRSHALNRWLSERFVRHPSEAVHVGDIVKVWVVDVDMARKRIALTMVKGK